ncbi:MAG: thioredoxin family protein [Bacteroidota bacterium]
MKKITLLLFTAIFAFHLQAQEESADLKINFDNADWENTLKKAKEEDKLIFVDAYTTWCGPCKWMDANVFTDEKVGEFYNENFINVKIDQEKGEGILFQKAYGVRGFPSFLFIDGKGEVVHRGIGSKPTAQFVSLGEAALDPEQQIGKMIKQYKEGDRSPEFLAEYADSASKAGLSEAGKVMGEYLDTQDNWLNEANVEMLVNMSYSMRPNQFKETKYFEYIKENRKALYEHSDKGTIDGILTRTIIYSFPRQNPPSDEEMVAALEEALPGQGEQILEMRKVENLIYKARNDDALKQEFLEKSIALMEKYDVEDSNFLNSIAWSFYEFTDDKKMLEKAKVYAQKSIKADSNFMNNDTLAAICYKLKEKKAAMKHAELAIQLAKENDQDASETEALLEKIMALD